MLTPRCGYDRYADDLFDAIFTVIVYIIYISPIITKRGCHAGSPALFIKDF